MTCAHWQAPGLPLKLAVALLSVLSLVSCGGDSGGSEEERPSTIALGGLVADRGPWAGADLTLTCAEGQPVHTRAASDGRYALNISAASLPCLVQATSSQGERLWSVATSAGTVNITPPSDWTVARALRLTTAGLRPDRSMLRTLTPAAVAQAQADVRQALASNGWTADGDLISATAGAVLDAQLLAQQRVLGALATRDVRPLALRHALALQRDAAALATALQQGRLADAMALPSHKSDALSMPQLASGLLSLLTGPADTVFGVNAEGGWRSTDGGRQWSYVNHPLAQVLRWRGRLWARDHDGLLVSGDDGLSWAADPMSPRACSFDKDVLLPSPAGRLWFFPDSSCTGVRDYFSDDGLTWQSQAYDGGYFRLDVLQTLARREPPLRQVFFRDNTRERITSCLGGICVDSAVLDWPYVHWLMPVEGSGELIAGLTDARTGLAPSMALSADAIGWQSMSFVSFNSMYRVPQGHLLASPGANGLAGVNPRVQRSSDNGKTWQISDPALNAVDGWVTVGADTRLRRSAVPYGPLQLSVDAGRNWANLPALVAELDRRGWKRAPDGTLLRNGETAVQASTDDGVTWRDVAAKGSGPVWLDDRWVILTPGRLLTSVNGLQWTDAPNGLAGTPWANWFLTEPVSDNGVWVMSAQLFITPHSPVQKTLLESKDQGRSWAESPRSDALALRCGGMQYLRRPRISDGILTWQMRTDADPVWRALALPAGIEATTSLQPDCDRGMLRLVAGLAPSSARLPYYNVPSGRRGHSHWLSPDHGQHWFPVGRPGTDLFWVEGRWWSLGLDSVMLWP